MCMRLGLCSEEKIVATDSTTTLYSTTSVVVWTFHCVSS